MTTPAAEFSRPIAVESLDEGGVALTVEADAAERERLAERFGLIAIDRLTGKVQVTPKEGGAMFHLEGSFQADVVQTCVVTLEELTDHVEESFERQYSAPDEPAEMLDEQQELDEKEPPDPIVDGHIDVGEAIAEELALSLNPFPRKPGISFTDYSSGPEATAGRSGVASGNSRAADGPFAALQRLKDQLK
jgi:uncharacterized metal-binding protein YceD (DUF177 family)